VRARLFSLLTLFVAAFLCKVCWAVPESKDAPEEETVLVTYPRFTYKSGSCDLDRSRLGEVRAYIFESRGRILDSGLLKRGRYEKWTAEKGYASAHLGDVHPLPSVSADKFLLVIYHWEWAGGSSSQSDVAQVFGCIDGKPAVLQQISNDAHSENTNIRWDAGRRVLTVKSVNYGTGAHCCPEKLEIVEFKWTGSRLTKLLQQRVPMPQR